MLLECRALQGVHHWQVAIRQQAIRQPAIRQQAMLHLRRLFRQGELLTRGAAPTTARSVMCMLLCLLWGGQPGQCSVSGFLCCCRQCFCLSWSRANHQHWPESFKAATRILLLAASRPASSETQGRAWDK